MTDQEKERTCPFCKTELLLPLYMYGDFHCPYCGANIGEVKKNDNSNAL